MNGVFRAARYLVLLFTLVAWTHPARAQERPPEQPYRQIPAQPPLATTDKIEVIDFFWYGCPYCYDLLPALQTWIQSAPADVVIRRVPAVLRKDWVPDARLFYTLDALGETGRLHAKVYEAIHREQLKTSDADAVAEWAVRNGIEWQRWTDTYTSAAVEQRIQRATALARDYDIHGTPSIVVDGRYLTSGGLAGGVKNVMPVVNSLLAAAREQRRGH